MGRCLENSWVLQPCEFESHIFHQEYLAGGALLGHLSILPNGLRRMKPCQILVIGGAFIFGECQWMTIQNECKKELERQTEQIVFIVTFVWVQSWLS
ncbi:hypothetical protein APD02_19405 [Acinetobacter baumannii]|uniref:Uncharacterized protein n=1 Tax=Acinetobacter baumannii TaxID=470 RepID=A0A0E1FN41_ACIBA|nr:hypothetical protein IX87_18640 [Acinetobacter baumannii]RSC55130.1 hypothetical protein EGT34_15350 [Acinetobacter sp. FDAARGOS_558]ATD20965.1 hypothetical protein BS098_14120 [Acinetobacter baumannii]AVO91300.1 hypothetical protein AM480_10835 [Acinetobacter baumannii]AVO91361.1 hypothetical protein AM480_11210 [Acinetobacter baumannii]